MTAQCISEQMIVLRIDGELTIRLTKVSFIQQTTATERNSRIYNIVNYRLSQIDRIAKKRSYGGYNH